MKPSLLCFTSGMITVLLVYILIDHIVSEQNLPAPQTTEQYMTFYTWLDNDPPGNAIAYPHSSFPRTVHETAGGIGTYADPITVASDPTGWAIGTRMYAPFLRKYLVMEDWCEGCVRNWRQSHKHHIDVWMNSNPATGEAVHECAYRWTQERTPIEINPPRNRSVDTRPLFDTATNSCPELPAASGAPSASMR
jgi:3D (Asp-Asp-Asp) domain-containing protein